MAATLELSTRIDELLNSQEVPVIAVGKLRDLKIAEVSDFVGLAARARDLGGLLPTDEVKRTHPRGGPSNESVRTAHLVGVRSRACAAKSQ